MDRRLYDKYRVNLDEKFKRDLLEAYVSTYGEENRKRFEERINNIEIHPKFTMDDLKNYIKQNGKNEDFSLELQAIEKYEKGKVAIQQETAKQKVQVQYKLIEEIKKKLPPHEGEKLQSEMCELEEKGKLPITFDELSLSFIQLLEGVDVTELMNAMRHYRLDNREEANRSEQFVEDYFSNMDKIKREEKNKINEEYSSYQIICEECEDYNIDIDLLEEFNTPGSFVSTFSEKQDFHKTKEHIFIALHEEKENTLGTLAHEIGHSLEKEIEIDEATKSKNVKTGFDGKMQGVDTTLLSECIHVIILETRIFPYLRNLGYEINDKTDYKYQSLKSNMEFFEKFEKAILTARCGNIDSLLNVVGRESFIEYVNLQNNYRNSQSDEQANDILKKMMKNSKEKLAVRIGKATLDEQSDIKGKEKVSHEIKELISEQNIEKEG